MSDIRTTDGIAKLAAIHGYTTRPEGGFSKKELGIVIQQYFGDVVAILIAYQAEDWKGLAELFSEQAETLNFSCRGESSPQEKEQTDYKLCRALIHLCDRLEVEVKRLQTLESPSATSATP